MKAFLNSPKKWRNEDVLVLRSLGEGGSLLFTLLCQQKLFTQNRRFSSLPRRCRLEFSFCHLPDLCRNRRDTPPKTQKRRQDFSCRRGSVAYRSGKPKSLRCSFQSSGMFFIICAMDNPSGSVPAAIASTMSGARLFTPSIKLQ